jgi:hypothetical protein
MFPKLTFGPQFVYFIIMVLQVGVELDTQTAMSIVQQLSQCDTLATVAGKQGFQVQTNKEELIRIGVGP